jgi:hypothetical protein
MSALYNAKNVFHVLVSGNVTATADATLITQASDLQTGEVAILDLDNKTVLHATSQLGATETFRFVHSDGTTLHYSPWINAAKVIGGSYKAYAAAVQQVSYIGYVGSGTGNIEALDLNEYIIRVLIQGTETTFGNKQMYKFGAYKSGNTAYSADIALGLVGNLYYNFKREPIQTILFEAISNGTTTASSGGTWAVYNGSTTVTVAESSGAAGDAGKYNSDGSTLVVGDYIRFGHATTTTYPVYQVMAISGAAGALATITLDHPYTGTSNAALAAASVGCMASATGLAATWGIKCTGVAWTNFKAGVFGYGVTRFKIEPQNCGNTAVTYTTAAYEGVGVRSQVQELEWFAQGNLGNKYRIGTPPPTMYDNTVSGGTYNILSLKYYDKQGDSALDAAPASIGEIVIPSHVTGTGSSGLYDMFVHMGWVV